MEGKAEQTGLIAHTEQPKGVDASDLDGIGPFLLQRRQGTGSEEVLGTPAMSDLGTCYCLYFTMGQEKMGPLGDPGPIPGTDSEPRASPSLGSTVARFGLAPRKAGITP